MSVEHRLSGRSTSPWPEGFMWGTGASSTQCEGAAPASDWLAWEEAGHAPRSGDGNGFVSHYAHDFALFASLGLTHHRLSIEWARGDLAGAFDLFGFSYYNAIGVAGGRIVPHPPAAPKSPLGYAIWADGLGLVLQRVHGELPGTPLLVCEYGIGTEDDEQRATYLERGLEVVGEALARGIEVRGMFHWTGVDNYEWLHGYDVHFGIVDRDRHARPSARALQREALERDHPP